jgi:hypothetical protein
MLRAANLPLRLLLPCALVAGCTETVRLSRDPLDELVAVEVAPATATVTVVDLAPPHHTLQYAAMGTFADGTMRDITPLVAWTVDNAYLGRIDDGGLFTASHGTAGRGEVTAHTRGLVATGALTVTIDATIVDPIYPPPGADLFDPPKQVVTGDPTNAPALIYPADGTMFPENIARTLFQYRPGATNDAFRLVFESEVLRVAVETGASRWQADGALQRLLATTGIAGPIRVTVEGTSSTTSGPVYQGNAIEMAFSGDAPSGLLYFWSAATNGIMRGGVDLLSASKLYPASTTCAGCHAVNRDGSEIAVALDDAGAALLATVNLKSLTTRILPIAERPMGWASYSPDGSRLIVANDGALTQYEAATGASLGAVPLPPMRYATHPDWAPDGSYVAVALTSQSPSNKDVRAASIARIPFDDGSWGTPEIVVSGSPSSNNYFPRVSPDGSNIAFVRASGGSQGASSAELMIVPAGGGQVRPLRLANRRVGTLDDVPGLANTMPAWSSALGSRAWLAFVSSRGYGAVHPTGGRGQIWVTSLDLSVSGDPSTAAFWLPCQDITVLNNNPVWSKIDFAQ